MHSLTSQEPVFSLPRFVVPLAVTHIAFSGGRIALALFAIHLGASVFAVGVLVSLLAALPMLLSVHVGRASDRFGHRIPAVVFMAIASAGALLPFLHPSLPTLYAASLLIGCGVMGVHVIINNAIGRLSAPGNRAQVFSMAALGFSLSSIGGPVLAGAAIDLLGHARAFAVLAAFPLVGLVVMLVLHARYGTTGGSLAGTAAPHVGELLRHAPLRRVLIVSGLLSIAWDLFTFMVPVEGARRGLSASAIGLVMASFGVATFAVRLLLPWMARRATEWRLLMVSLALTAVGFAAMPFSTQVPVLLALAFLLGLAMGIAQPVVMTLLHVASPPGRSGEAVGIRTTVMNASQTFMPLLLGFLSSAGGAAPVFWAFALVAAGGAAFSSRNDRVPG